MEFAGHISQSVDTVRALHQTILSLKTALEQSRSEIDELKAKYRRGDVEDRLRSLTAENHVLRQRLLGNSFEKRAKAKRRDDSPKSKKQVKKREHGNSDCDSDTNLYVSTETISSSKLSKSLENLSFVKQPAKRNLTKSKTVTFSNISVGDKQISTTNSFNLKGKTKTRSHRQSESEPFKKAKRVRNLQSFTEEVIRDEREVCLGELLIPHEQNIVQELVDLKTTVQKSDFDHKEDIIVQCEDTSKLQEVEHHEDTREQSTEENETKDGEKLASIDEHESEKEVKSETEGILKPAIASDNSDTETPSNVVQKSTELGETLETALFGVQEKVEESQADGVNPQIIGQEVKLETTSEHFDPHPVEPENIEPSPTDEKERAESEEKEKDDTDTSGTLCSSDNKTVNNVEVSIKIFKGTNKKPIEIDVQTKRVKKGGKKMNDKSQNTSFDSDGGFRATNVIQNSENIVQNLLQNDNEQEVDDIELIFTTDDTKDTDFKEELVSIEPYASSQLLQCPQTEYDEKADVSDRELEDDVFNDNFEGESCGFQSQTFDFRREHSQIYNSKSDNSINHEDKSLKSYYSYQDSSFENKSLEKDESFDRFEEKVRIIETDISKVGIQDVDYNMGRRNTCPNPLQYRPIMHREALGRGLNSRKCRPILAHSNVVRKDCGAQTDISAIPGSSWRSESSLAHKVKIGENFTTLPSKFPHPASRLKLSEKTVEARRVLLSDIGFTSMVPELSRSADHLCPPNVKAPSTGTYGQFLRTPDLYSPGYTSQKFMWTATTASPSEASHSQSRYSSQYPLSSPPAPVRRCSAPVSPSRRTTTLKSTPSRVRFANGSLPELRGDWTTTVDSGESTDSLVEEAEHFLRRSIDCLAPTRDIYFRSDQPKGSMRRASAPEPSRDNVPPPGWQPFLPRVPRDLHLDYWVKVISQEGRVRGGRVRYVGPLMSQVDQFVGVQLSTPDGHSDGTFNNRRYFNCEPYHGIFVPFKKIIMGWRP